VHHEIDTDKSYTTEYCCMVVNVCTRLYNIFVSNIMGFKNRNITTMVTTSFCNMENGITNYNEKITEIMQHIFHYMISG